jgi:hypothetical protein
LYGLHVHPARHDIVATEIPLRRLIQFVVTKTKALQMERFFMLVSFLFSQAN